MREQINELADHLPQLKDAAQPAGQLWLEILQELDHLSVTTNLQYLVSEVSAAISEVTDTISDMDHLLQTLTHLIQKQFDFSQVVIFLLNETGEWLELQAETGQTRPDPSPQPYRLPLTEAGQTALGQAIQTRQPVLATYEQGDSPPAYMQALAGPRLEIILPLMSRGELLGALLLISQEEAAFASQKKQSDILQPVAAHVANAIRTTQLFTTIDRQLEQMAALYHISLQVGSRLKVDLPLDDSDFDFEVLLGDLAQLSLKLADGDASLVSLTDLTPQNPSITRTALNRSGPAEPEFPEAVEPILSPDVKRTRQALLANNRLQQPGADKKSGSTGRVLAAIGVPILLHNQTIGAIEIQSFTKTQAFSEGDLHILSLLASQAAIAIENAHLFNRAENSYRFLKTIIEHIPDPIFIKDRNHRWVEMNQANAAIMGQSYESLIGKTDHDFFPPELADEFHRRDDELFAANQSLTFEDKTVWADGQEHIAYTRLIPIPSEAEHPEYMLGITHDITERKAREIDKEKLLTEMAMLYNGSQAIANALSEKQIFEALFDQIQTLEPDEIAAYYFKQVDGEPIWAELGAYWQASAQDQADLSPIRSDNRLYLPNAPQAELLTTTTPLFIKNVSTDPLLSETVRKELLAQEIGAMAILPMIMTGQAIGVTVVSFARPHIFTRTIKRFWRAIIDQASVLLANRQLIQEVTFRAMQIETAAEVAQTASSILDVQQLLNSAVRLIRDRFDLYYVGVFLVDEAREWALLRAGTGEAGRVQLEKKHRLKIGGESMIGWSLANLKARIALDVGKEAVHFQNPHLPDTRSELALPLIYRSQGTGALTVQSTEPAAFSKQDTIFLQTMADQLANAIENARLFERAQQEIAERERIQQEILRRNEELGAINRVAKSATSTLDLRTLLQDTAREMVQIFDVQACGIALLNANRSELSIVSDYLARPDRPSAEGAVIPVEGNPSSQQVIDTGKPLVLPDAQNHPLTQAVRPLLEERRTQCLMLVPLQARGEVIGTLGLDTTEAGRKFSPAEVELAETMTGQIAGAVVNARLFEQTQTALRERQQAVEALRQEKDFNKILIDTSPAFFVAIDAGGQIKMMNKSMLTTLGYTPAEIIEADYLTALVPAADRRQISNLFERIVSGETTSDENRVLTKEGRTLLVEWHGTPIFKDDGALDFFFGVGVDITERKRAEEALRQAEEKYRSIVQNSPEGIFQTTPDGRYLSVNPALARIYNYASPETLMAELTNIGRQLYVDPARRDEFQRLMDKKDEVSTFESRVYRRGGDIIWISENARAVRDETGRLLYYEGTVADVTKRKQAEIALKKSEEQFRSLYNNTPVMMHSIDATGKLLNVNNYWLKSLGYDRTEVVGRPSIEFLTEASRRYAREVALPRFFKTGVARDEEYQMVKKNGDVIDVLLSAVVQRNEMGKISHTLAFIVDVTERKKTEKALAAERNLLRTLIDNLPDYIYVKDKEGRFLINNAEHIRVLGAETAEEVIGKTDFDFFPQELAGQYQADEQAILETGQPLHNKEEPVVEQEEQSLLWMSVTKVPLRDQTGQITGLVGISRDITDRKKSEETLRSAFERTQSLYRISDTLATATAERTTFEAVLGEYLHLLNLKRGGIVLLDEAGGYNELRALYIDGQPAEPDWRLALEEDLIGQQLAADPSPLIIEEVAAHPATKDHPQFLAQVETMLLIPLIVRDKVVGRFGADATKKNYTFSQDDIEAGKLIADQLSIWLENRQLLVETQKRSTLLQTGAEVSRTASSILDVDELIDRSVNLIRDKFDFYYVGLFLVAQAGEWAVLRAGTGEAGRVQLAKNHRLKIGGESMIGWCVQNGRARIALDVGEEAVHFQNPDLPDTHSEMALPLISRDEILGAVTVQSTRQRAFSDEDVTLLQTMADQLANAVKNAYLFEDVRQAQEEAEYRLQETIALQQLSQALSGTLEVRDILDIFFRACTRVIGFEYVLFFSVDKFQGRIKVIGDVGLTEDHFRRTNRSLDSHDIVTDIVKSGKTEIINGWDDRFDEALAANETYAGWVKLFMPVTLRQENIGVVEAGFKTGQADIEEAQISLLRAFIDQTVLALDNAQRYEASQRAAQREALIKEITTKVRASTDIDTILRTTLKEISEAVKGGQAYVHLITPKNGKSRRKE